MKSVLLIFKSVLKLCLVVVWIVLWLSVSYIQHRVWSELPRQVHNNALALLPVYGCSVCETTSQTVFLCSHCSVYNASIKEHNSHISALHQTTNVIARDAFMFQWYVLYIANEIALNPTGLMTVIQLIEIGSSLWFAFNWSFNEILFIWFVLKATDKKRVVEYEQFPPERTASFVGMLDDEEDVRTLLRQRNFTKRD
jgi:hypothetical protein